MKAALYARLSTAHNGQDPQVQLRELREYCQRRGWEMAGEFVDTEHGNVDSRPQLNELFRQAKMRRFDAVVVYRYDRFARSMRQLVKESAAWKPHVRVATLYRVAQGRSKIREKAFGTR